MAMTADPSAQPGSSRRRPVRHIVRALFSPDSFGSVLVLILITYCLSVSLNQEWQRSVVLFVQIATVWLALRVSDARRVVRLLASVVLVVAGAIAVMNLVGVRGKAITAIIFLTSSLLYLIAPMSILRAIVSKREVDQETVLGAIDAYLLLGMFFAFVYQALGALWPPFFEGGTEGPVAQSVAQSLFFSFTTLTTTGYGNLVPAANPGQSIAVMEMLIGQLFLVTAVAKVINAWRPARWAAVQQAPDAPARPPTTPTDAPSDPNPRFGG
jgi:hypothetical protein